MFDLRGNDARLHSLTKAKWADSDPRLQLQLLSFWEQVACGVPIKPHAATQTGALAS
jgi:hypothetical protein